jgi:hypothetical protein
MPRPLVLPAWATLATYPAGAQDWANQPPRVQPTAGELAQGFIPAANIPAEYFNWLIGQAFDWIGWFDSSFGLGVFGDGSDGDVTISTTVTLTRDMFYNNLSIVAGGILNTNAYRIYVKNTLTTSGGGRVRFSGNTGNAGPTGTGASAIADGTVAGSIAGGNNATVGNNIATNGFGGAGGAGGTGTGSPGAGGTVTPPVAAMGDMKGGIGIPGHLIGGGILALARGGASGGGGSGASGGGGGGGGGTMVIVTRLLSLASAGDIASNGGNGGPGAANSGGGGGGGGGLLQIIYASKNAGITFSAATNCPGGLGGAGAGTGITGNNGANGTLIDLRF